MNKKNILLYLLISTCGTYISMFSMFALPTWFTGNLTLNNIAHLVTIAGALPPAKKILGFTEQEIREEELRKAQALLTYFQQINLLGQVSNHNITKQMSPFAKLDTFRVSDLINKLFNKPLKAM